LQHSIGIGPLTIDDHTESLEARAPRLLRLRARVRPLTAQVTLELTAQNGGTLVRMTENLDGAAALLDLNPLLQVLTKLRNAESLQRLELLALRLELHRTRPRQRAAR
jgi:hypothetical protein